MKRNIPITTMIESKKIKQPTCANSINYIWNNPNQNPTLRNVDLS